jgi:hypothetical protein
MSISARPSSYLVGSNSIEGIRYLLVEQAAQAFLNLPAVDRPFVICRSWDGQKWTSRIIARTRDWAGSVWLKEIPCSFDAAFSAAYADAKNVAAQAGQNQQREVAPR